MSDAIDLPDLVDELSGVRKKTFSSELIEFVLGETSSFLGISLFSATLSNWTRCFDEERLARDRNDL